MPRRVKAGQGNIAKPDIEVVPANLPLFTVLPGESKIESQTLYPDLGITQWQLGNGITVQLQPEKAANGRVYISMEAPGGRYSLKAEQNASLSVFLPSLQGSGLAGLSAQQLHQKLKSADVSLTPFVTHNSQGFSLEAGKQGLETAFSTLYSAFTGAKVDPKVFKAAKNRLLEQQTYALKLPAVKAQQKLLSTLYPDNAYEAVFTVEQIKAVSQQDIESLYQQLIASANGYQFTLVGDFDVEEVKPLVEKYIVSLPGGQRHAYAKTELPFIAKQSSITETVNPQDRADLTFFYLFDKTDGSIDEVYAADIIGRIMGQRLMKKVREELSLTYTPSVACGRREPGAPYGSCSISIISESEHAEKAQQAVADLVAEIVSSGVSASELELHKRALAQGMASSVKDVKDRQMFLHRDSMYGLPVGSIYRSEDIIDRLDMAYVNQLLKTYFNQQHHLAFANLPQS